MGKYGPGAVISRDDRQTLKTILPFGEDVDATVGFAVA